MVTAFDQARAVYESEPCARPFYEDLLYHLHHGYLWNSPTAFAMVRRVSSLWAIEDLREPWRIDEAGDCWWIWLLAGDVRECIEKLPYPLPHIGFERLNVPRILPTERFLSRLQKPLASLHGNQP